LGFTPGVCFLHCILVHVWHFGNYVENHRKAIEKPKISPLAITPRSKTLLGPSYVPIGLPDFRQVRRFSDVRPGELIEDVSVYARNGIQDNVVGRRITPDTQRF
ncbi:unnamed protein product, partial [Ixodes persulcatus]